MRLLKRGVTHLYHDDVRPLIGSIALRSQALLSSYAAQAYILFIYHHTIEVGTYAMRPTSHANLGCVLLTHQFL